MASPVAVIANPADPNDHLLFYINGTTQQLAMEVRPVNTSTFTPFVNNGPATGSIQVNPLAVVLKKNVPTVYGTSKPQGRSGPTYVSILSPYYNPISADPGAQTTTPGLAACSDDDANDWVYYLRQPDGQVTYQITEFLVDGVNTTPSTPWKGTSASTNSNLAVVFFKATQERFVIYANTDDDVFLYWVNSGTRIGNPIPTTSNVRSGSPLAVASVEGSDSTGPYLNIYLYYMDANRELCRIAGRARDSQITWFQSNQVQGASRMKATTDISATNTESTNYIYYITDGGSTFARFKDTISPGWFHTPPKEEATRLDERPAPKSEY
ncbi:wall-associated proteinase [Chaetomium strumarium]|uniref:Wall-associated proteinase n=1 Tax=Chaetomium strumarium TaxID=1170767 RepID=A0AAJ0GW04_9PEZI|nr:wall-associated proteinase [Chaetomium strumarium]